MTTYDNTNKGTLAKNDRKTEPNHPDIAGSINVNGTDYWLNGWQKTNSRDGSKFYSLTVKPKQERAAEIRREASKPMLLKGQATYAEQSGGDREPYDDTIPF